MALWGETESNRLKHHALRMWRSSRKATQELAVKKSKIRVSHPTLPFKSGFGLNTIYMKKRNLKKVGRLVARGPTKEHFITIILCVGQAGIEPASTLTPIHVALLPRKPPEPHGGGGRSYCDYYNWYMKLCCPGSGIEPHKRTIAGCSFGPHGRKQSRFNEF